MGMMTWWRRRRQRNLNHKAMKLNEAFGLTDEEAKALLLRVAMAFGRDSVSKGLADLFPTLSARELFTIAMYAKVHHELVEFKARFEPQSPKTHLKEELGYVG